MYVPQQSLRELIADMEKAGLITRIKDEKRVDELPMLMEQNPETAILVEKVKDCPSLLCQRVWCKADVRVGFELRCEEGRPGNR